MKHLTLVALSLSIIWPGQMALAADQPSATPATAAAVTIDAAQWLSGYWAGEIDGAQAEEIWGPPANGTMLGSFRLMANSAAVFYELIIITEQDGNLVMKLKHFNPQLEGWEAADVSQQFPLLSHAPGELLFKGISYQLTAPDTLRVEVTVEESAGAKHNEVFVFQRQPLAP